MDRLPGYRLHYRAYCVCYGGCWFQGEMVGNILGVGLECIQCLRKQLVESFYCTPYEGFPQVCRNFVPLT